MEVRILRRNLLEKITIENIFLIAGAIDQPELVSQRPLRPVKEPLDESPYGRNPGAGADENGVLQRITQNEHAMRAMKIDGLPFFYVAQQVGKEAIIHAVQAQVEARGIVRRRSDGVGTGYLPALFGGDE